jgi:hypothetical protein
VQTGGDNAAHYKTAGDTGKGCIHAAYQLVCKTGKITLKKGSLLKSLDNLYATYDVSFDFYPSSFARGWHSIIHLTRGGNHGRLGDRQPAVWAHASVGTSSSRALHICSGVNRVTNYCYNSQRIPVKKMVHIQIKQKLVDGKYIYSILLDNKVVRTAINNNPQAYQNVKVYAADPWYNAQDGYIQNLKITTKPPPGIILKKNSLVETIPILYQTYTVNFDLYAKSYARGYHSIIHLTRGGNGARLGDRIPAVWSHGGTSSSSPLHICSGINRLANYCFNTKKIAKGKWVHIEIKQEFENGKFMYRILINNNAVHAVANPNPLIYRNVKVYTADPWYKSLNGYIQNLKITTTKDKDCHHVYAIKA